MLRPARSHPQARAAPAPAPEARLARAPARTSARAPAPAPLFSLFSVLSLLLPSCRGPTLALHTTEPDAAIYLDGTRVGTGSAESDFRYYGTTHATVAPVRHDVAEDLRPATRFPIELPPPAPRWLFPLDFVLEAFVRGFGDAADTSASLPIEPARGTLTSGVLPPQPEPLRARAAAIQLAR